MENPIISMAQAQFVVISKHTRSLAMHVGNESHTSFHSVVCRFLENDQDLFAAVIAPHDNPQRLAQRVVSFISAYLRVSDTPKMERDMLSCLESCLRQRA
jgi:hypothetical protein